MRRILGISDYALPENQPALDGPLPVEPAVPGEVDQIGPGASQQELAQVPVARDEVGWARKARLICSGVASCLNCLMGGSTRVHGGSTRWQGSSGLVRGGCGCGSGTSGSSGRLSPCLPDNGAPQRRCQRPVLAWSSIPADRGHRFCSSGVRTGDAAGRRRRCSPAGCRPGRPLSC